MRASRPAIGISSRSSAARLAAARLAALLALVTLAAACVSSPRAVGPTTLSGPVPPPAAGATATASRAPGATDGPLMIRDPRVEWTHTASTESTYAWACTVENPADEGFRVTIVVHMLDANGRQLSSANQAFRIEGKSTMEIDGFGLVEGAESNRVASWRLEYWVQLAAIPIRD
jgi:hypothetical protein